MDINEKIVSFVLSDDFSKCNLLDARQKQVTLNKIKHKMSFGKIGKIIKRSSTQSKNIFNRSLFLIEIFLTEKTPIMLISESGLSKRIKNCFYEDENIVMLKDFDKLHVKELMRRNLGKTSVNEINEYIKDLGFSLVYEPTKEVFTGKFNRKFFIYSTDEDIFNLITSLIKFMKDRRNKTCHDNDD